MVELVDTQDLKSCGPQRPCGFDSRLGHKASHKCERLFLCATANQACLNERASIKKAKECHFKTNEVRLKMTFFERLWVRPDIEEDGECNEPAVPDIEEDGE